ncbi:MAG TPA: hypothetical protein VMT30_04025 [Candidatus Saccharimonadia bacterium]|nr:hypothetical protein [Candidatus Saccharimonadia bacterium]
MTDPEHSKSAELPTPPPRPNPEYLGPSGLAIERIEQARLFPKEKVDLLLVALGEKPATLHRLSSPAWAPGETQQGVPEDEFQAYMTAAEATGLAVEVGPDHVVNPAAEYIRGTDGEVVYRQNPSYWDARVAGGEQETWRTIFVARDQPTLEFIKAADAANDARALGQAYGFPETATDAYLAGHIEHASAVGESDPAVLAFAAYGLSPEHGAEELAVARRWADAVRQASPRIADELINYDPRTFRK